MSRFDLNSHFGLEAFFSFRLLYGLDCSRQPETEELGTPNQEAKP